MWYGETTKMREVDTDGQGKNQAVYKPASGEGDGCPTPDNMHGYISYCETIVPCFTILCNIFLEVIMCKEEMIDSIFEMVRNADAETIESFYWFLLMELES